MKITDKNKKRLILLPLGAAITAGLLFAAFYNGLTVTEYAVHSDKIAGAVRAVLITDLHNNLYGKNQRTLIEKIEEQSPDLVLMVGDIMDRHRPDDDDGAISLLEGIADKYPCYYVSGNHEFWSGRAHEQKEILRAYGVAVLEGDSASITIRGQEIIILGIDDPAGGWMRFDEQLENLSELILPQKYTILLSHRPELFERYAELDVDLVLSGHAHGGQWRVPFILPNGLFAPDQGFFPKYTNGVHSAVGSDTNADDAHDDNNTYDGSDAHSANGTQMIVSRGVSRFTMIIPRIFNPPELVVIDLLPAQ